jgi:ferritin
MNKGYTNLSKYMADWADEEITHGKWVKEFMESLNIPLVGGTTTAPTYNFDSSPIAFVDAILEREDLTTELYMKMSDRALTMDYLGSAMLLSFAQKVSTEQIEETDKVTTLYSQVKNLDSWGLLQLFDNSFEGK